MIPCPTSFPRTGNSKGKKSHFSDRFTGYSVWVSHDNPDFKTSPVFAELIGKEMKAQGLEYAHQHTQPIKGALPASAAGQGDRRL